MKGTLNERNIGTCCHISLIQANLRKTKRGKYGKAAIRALWVVGHWLQDCTQIYPEPHSQFSFFYRKKNPSGLHKKFNVFPSACPVCLLYYHYRNQREGRGRGREVEVEEGVSRLCVNRP